jgi:hypothetical protein
MHVHQHNPWTDVAVVERMLPVFRNLELVVVDISHHNPDASLLIPSQLSQLYAVSLRSLHWEVCFGSNQPILLNLPRLSHLEALELVLEDDSESDDSVPLYWKILAFYTSTCPNCIRYCFQGTLTNFSPGYLILGHSRLLPGPT